MVYDFSEIYVLLDIFICINVLLYLDVFCRLDSTDSLSDGFLYGVLGFILTCFRSHLRILASSSLTSVFDAGYKAVYAVVASTKLVL